MPETPEEDRDDKDAASEEAAPVPVKSAERADQNEDDDEDDEGDSKAEKAEEEEKAPTEEGDKDKEEALFVRGNPLRWMRGGITALVASFMAYLLMAHNGQLKAGVPLGIVLILAAAWGVMDLVGSFDDTRDDDVVGTVDLRALAAPLGTMVVATLLFGLALAGGQSGIAKQWHWGIIVTVAFLGLVASVFDLGVKLGPWAKDELGLARPLWERHGFWLIVLASLLYLPTLGSFSLWDPWETHYGEVAREMLARDDWISLWWAQDGWFWSKPILNFWIQAIAMASLGTHYQPDKMLMGQDGLANAHPEWVVRAPNFLLALVAMYLLYKGVSKVYGRRAGFIGGVVLATMPDWYFMAHQTMTDMPFVAAMTSAMGLLLLGLNTDENAQARLIDLRVGETRFRLSAWHLVFGAILVCALPQILYLISRNFPFVVHGSGGHGFDAHWDEFRSGSGMGNCGLPGNEACVLTNPASIPKNAGIHPETFRQIMSRLFLGFEPVIQGIVWGAGVAGLLYMNWGERRVQRLYYLAAWFFAAIATMGKGPAGFGLPVLCGLFYIGSTRRWKRLVSLELVSGLLIILVVAIPWFVAMYVRHGSPFTDRLIFHDMFNRAFHHVHDTNEGDDTSFRFYVWQLGYALFPWTGLAPLGLLYWLRKTDTGHRMLRPWFLGTSEPTDEVPAGDRETTKADASVFLVMWFVIAFGLFSFMGTKFHHYIFPAVPPVAALIGIVLDDMLEGKSIARGWGWLPVGLGACGVALIVVEGVTGWVGGTAWGDHVTSWETFDKQLLGVGVGVVVLALVLRFTWPAVFAPRQKALKTKATKSAYRGDAALEGPASKKAAAEESELLDPAKAHERLMIGAAALAGALVLGIVGRDLSIKPDNADQPGAIRLLHLFTYNYRRAWPDSLDFNAVLTAFSIVACVVALLFVVQAIRRYAVVIMLGFSFVWALWGLDVYMFRTAPHWGQHEVMQAYYDARKGPEEPLVAYQMNWKGENFYTGNKIPAFVSSGANFTTWVKGQKDKGTKVVFFVTEHSRTGGLKSESGAKNFKEITDKDLCNKFVIVRAEL